MKSLKAEEAKVITHEKDVEAANALIENGNYQQALEQCKELWQDISSNIIMKPLRKKIKLLCCISSLEEKLGNYQSSISWLDIAEKLLPTFNEMAQLEKFNLYIRKASTLIELRRYSDSDNLLQKAQEISSKIGSISIENVEFLETQGELLLRKGHYEEALQRLQQAREIVVNFDNGLLLTSVETRIARALTAKGRYSEALELFRSILKWRVENLRDGHPDIGDIYYRLGILYGLVGKYDEAIKNSALSLEITKKAFGEAHPKVADIYLAQGDNYRLMQNFQLALELTNKSLEIRIKIYGITNPILSMNYNNLGVIYLNQGMNELALYNFQKSLNLKIEHYGANHPDIALSYNNIGLIYSKEGNLDKALQNYHQALRIHQISRDEDHPYIMSSYTDISWIYILQKKLNDALKYCKKPLRSKKNLADKSRKVLGVAYYYHGYVFELSDNVEGAQRSFQKSKIMTAQMNLPDSHQFVKALSHLSKTSEMKSAKNQYLDCKFI